MNFEGSLRRIVIVRWLITFVIVLLFWCLAIHGVSVLPTACTSAGTHRTYTTNFPLTENPISEGGKWTNGQTVGLDWANMRIGVTRRAASAAPGRRSRRAALGLW